MTTTLLETCRIAPPAAEEEQSLPLTFADIIWLPFLPIRRLIFYDLPSSNPSFLQTIVPKLKQSLSLALKRFFPFAASALYSLTSDTLPRIRFLPGDSVSLTICESTHDFDTLVANHPRDADTFYDCVPQLPPPVDESGFKLQQLLALQLTLFPGRGVCIGVTNHHSAGDASSIAGFIRTWASINKLGGEEELLISGNEYESLPVFDRSLFNYPPKLDSFFWNQIKEIPFSSLSFPLPTKMVRATYVLGQSELGKLKHSIQSRNPNLGRVSSFVAMAAYVWWCFAKSGLADEEEKIEDDDVEFFLFAVDMRARLDPEVPRNYFGNCLSYGLGKVDHGELVGEDGMLAAAEAVAKSIRERVSGSKNILEDAENWVAEIASVQQRSVLAVSGSARVDLYGADFGWGKARKLEVLSIDGEKFAMSLSRSRDFEGGLEIGMSLGKVRMEAFAAAFAHGINNF